MDLNKLNDIYLVLKKYEGRSVGEVALEQTTALWYILCSKNIVSKEEMENIINECVELRKALEYD